MTAPPLKRSKYSVIATYKNVRSVSFQWHIHNFNHILHQTSLIEQHHMYFYAWNEMDRVSYWKLSLKVNPITNTEPNKDNNNINWIGITASRSDRLIRENSISGGIFTFSVKTLRKEGEYGNHSGMVGTSDILEIKEFISLREPINNSFLDENMLRICVDFDITIPGEVGWTPSPLEPQVHTGAYEELSKNILELRSNKFKDISPGDMLLKSKSGKTFACHREILAARSPRFYNLCRTKDANVEDELIDISDTAMEVILHYIYTGEIKSSWKCLSVITEFTRAAGRLELDFVLNFLNHNLGTACTKGTAIELLKLADEFNLGIATQKLMHYIKVSISEMESPKQLVRVLQEALLTGRTSLDTLLQHKEIIDAIVNEIFVLPMYPGNSNANNQSFNRPRFSNIFPVLFSTDEKKRTNLLSFLEVMVTSFSRNSDNVLATQASDRIFDRLGMMNVHMNLKHFLTYLIEIYQKVLGRTDATVWQNIFALMTDFPIHETKIAFVFNTPSGVVKSCGYALHGAKVLTTKVFLDYLDMELKEVSKFSDSGASPELSVEALAQVKEECNLGGLISQGVLLFNSLPTYQDEIWNDFTHNLVQALSASGKPLIVILAGNIAQNKEIFITNQPNHLVLKVYHPTSSDASDQSRRWTTVLPFTNANFFLYQKHEKNLDNIVDWNTVSQERFLGAQKDTDKCNKAAHKRLFDVLLEKKETDSLKLQEGPNGIFLIARK